MKIVLAAVLMLSAIVIGSAVWYRAGFPEVTRNVLVSATAEVDGRQASGTSVWQVTLIQQAGLGVGRNLRSRTGGNAVAIRLGPGQALFVGPRASFVTGCLGSIEAQALENFAGCEVRDAPTFVFADISADGSRPLLGRFYWKDGSMRPLSGAQVLDPVSAALQQHGFRLISLRVDPTDEAQGRSLTEEYPWILALPRSDCGFDCSMVAADTIYANDFTTLLPNGNANPF